MHIAFRRIERHRLVTPVPSDTPRRRSRSEQPWLLTTSTPHAKTMSSSPYDAARRVNLIKSPSVSVPPAIAFPTDLHPLPPDLQAYFVYPFSLESYVLDPNSPNSRTIDELHSRHTGYLEWRAAEQNRIEGERLRRVAPGWSATAAPLQPNRRSVVGVETAAVQEQQAQGPMDAMQELVEHLSKLDAAGEERGTS